MDDATATVPSVRLTTATDTAEMEKLFKTI